MTRLSLPRPELPLYSEETDWLRKTLPIKRFEHSLRVADLAFTLGHFHGVTNPELAYLAGLLHDNAKYKTPDDIEQSGIPRHHCFTELYAQYPVIWHAFIGPRLIQQFTTNKDVLHAMRWHTTGRDRLRPIAQLVYIADYCEPGRTQYNRDYIYNLAVNDLTKAMAVIAHEQYARHGSDTCFWATKACWRYYRWHRNMTL